MSFAVGTKSTMNKIMNSWNGEHIDSVIAKWGYPTKESTIAGHKLYIWDKKNNGRAVHDWLTDISDAYHENMLIWEDVWEYLGGDEELD